MRNMSAQDYESFRQQGFAVRRAASESFLNQIIVPEKWLAKAEYQQEFGGLPPIHLRFWPEHGRFFVSLCSPGTLSNEWKLIMSSAGSQRIMLLRRYKEFNSTQVSNVLICISRLDSEGCIYEGIVNKLLNSSISDFLFMSNL